MIKEGGVRLASGVALGAWMGAGQIWAINTLRVSMRHGMEMA